MCQVLTEENFHPPSGPLTCDTGHKPLHCLRNLSHSQGSKFDIERGALAPYKGASASHVTNVYILHDIRYLAAKL